MAEGRGDGAEPLEFGVAVTVGELATLYDPLGGDAVEAPRGHLGTDSLMMIKFINDLRASGLGPAEAIISGAKERFRAIMLTSVTTFLGVAPLVFETSTHAQHLVPLATSVGFGVLFATLLLMLVVPALVMAQYNLADWRDSRRLARA